MSETKPIPLQPQQQALDVQRRPEQLLEVWRASLSDATRRAYAGDLADFAAYVKAESPQQAVEQLLRGGKVHAEQVVLAYLLHLADQRGLAVTTVARRRMALRSVVRMAEGLGFITWTLSAPLPRSRRPRSYRDTRGPGLAAVQRMRELAAAQGGEKSGRDVALVGLLFTLGLRRAEVCGLHVTDWEAQERKLSVVGKGRGEPELLTVPEPLAEELDSYLKERGTPTEGPLFRSLDRAGKGSGRLTPDGVYKLIRSLAKKAGVERRVSPHRLRHSSITTALDITGGDIRQVRGFARHGKIETTAIYDDARRDNAGAIASLVAGKLGQPQEVE